MFTHRLDADSELQILQPWHSDALFAVVDANRAHLREWLPWLDRNTRPEDSRAFIEAGLMQFAANNGFNAGIWHRRELVGVIGLHGINWPNRSTSLGYWLAASAQGNGLITRACRAVTNHALRELGLERVEIRAAVENHKSRAVPERLGFMQEGVIRKAEWLYEHHVDHVVYAMLAEDWR